MGMVIVSTFLSFRQCSSRSPDLKRRRKYVFISLSPASMPDPPFLDRRSAARRFLACFYLPIGDTDKTMIICYPLK
jgi:hypothetical protein